MPAPTVTTRTLLNAQQLAANLAIPTPRLITKEPATVPGSSAGMKAPTIIAGRFIQPFGSTLALIGGVPVVTNTAYINVAPSGATLHLTGGTPVVTLTTVNPPVFDAVTNFTSTTANHTGTAGADAFVFIITDESITVGAPTYGGTAMTQIATGQLAGGQTGWGVGQIRAYRLSGIPGGAQTVNLSLSGGFAANISAVVITYKGVTAVSTPTVITGSGSTVSQSLSTTQAGQLLLDALLGTATGSGGAFTSVSGGTGRSNINTANTALAVRESSASTTFSASGAGIQWYGGIGMVLSGS
ncbi:hypothetical protein A5747_13305 [Mycobacterium sp. IS-836]|uniref:hypothetical protein n=1 Tax=Mycobacterium sp. IS-836 TaxID=1834160 RepID=UPI00096C64B7|nr:hypothetical protein [Mycobacterium sp. IS-836]OMC55365.1 hypothetical protein A5747_13305 [Mycobacterium sp. IS-836]